MYSSLENTTYKEHKSHFWENFEKLCKFSLKMSIFCNIYLVDKKIIDILENFKKSVSLLYTLLVYDFEFTSSWSATSSLLHRKPPVINFRGGGATQARVQEFVRGGPKI